VVSIHAAVMPPLTVPRISNPETARAVIVAREAALCFYHLPLPSECIFMMPKSDGSGGLQEYVFKLTKHIVPARLFPIENVCTYKDPHFTGGKAFKAIQEARSLAKFERACEEIAR